MSQAALPHSHAGHPARTLIRKVDDLNTEVERPKVAEPGPTMTGPDRPRATVRTSFAQRAIVKAGPPGVTAIEPASLGLART
jgi:hypothetical protein